MKFAIEWKPKSDMCSGDWIRRRNKVVKTEYVTKISGADRKLTAYDAGLSQGLLTSISIHTTWSHHFIFLFLKRLFCVDK